MYKEQYTLTLQVPNLGPIFSVFFFTQFFSLSCTGSEPFHSIGPVPFAPMYSTKKKKIRVNGTEAHSLIVTGYSRVFFLF